MLLPEVQAGGHRRPDGGRWATLVGRAAMRERMETGTDFENISLLVGFDNILATSLHRPEDLPLEGKSIAEIADLEDKDPFDALFDLLKREACGPAMIDFITHEEDIADILRAPFSSVISDATYPTQGLPHPRVYGTFPRLLETYVRRRGVLTLPQAVRKMTRLPADRLGLSKKGRIEVGADGTCVSSPRKTSGKTARSRTPGSYPPAWTMYS